MRMRRRGRALDLTLHSLNGRTDGPRGVKTDGGWGEPLGLAAEAAQVITVQQLPPLFTSLFLLTIALYH